MKHIISVGHTASGNIGCGAVGKLNESNCTREISPKVVDYIKNSGEEAVLLRVDKSNSYNYEDCYERAAQANSISGDTFTEIHINAGGAGATGVEVLLNSMDSKMKPYAEKVCENISKALNIPNRGVKVQSLIVLKRTSMPAMLVECCFVDSPDAEKYNPDVIAKAIAGALVNKDLSQDNKKYYVVTNYLPHAYVNYDGVDINYVLSYFTGVKCYVRGNDKGVWIETEYLSKDKCHDLKGILGSWFYEIKEE